MDKYIDFTALGEVILVAFGAGVGIVVLFTVGTIGLDMVTSNTDTPTTLPAKILGGAIAFIGFATIAVLVVFGTYLMLRKS